MTVAGERKSAMRRWRFILTLILCVLLLTGCFGESVTPYEALQQTDIFALIGHTREEIYQMYLLSDDQVEETEEGTVQLPYDYCPYHEKEPWTRIPWQISLHFIRGKTESREDQIVSGWTLVSVYAGANASIRAKADYNTVGTAFAGTQVQTWIEQSETEEWSYRITMTYQADDPLSVTPAQILLPRVISEKQRLLWQNLTGGIIWIYLAVFLGMGLALVLSGRIFGRKKTATARYIKVDDGQDINARNFLAIPVGTIYQQRRMGNAATPMNEEFLTSRKLLFAPVDMDDRLLTLRSGKKDSLSLTEGKIYRIVYRAGRLLKIEQTEDGQGEKK